MSTPLLLVTLSEWTFSCQLYVTVKLSLMHEIDSKRIYSVVQCYDLAKGF